MCSSCQYGRSQAAIDYLLYQTHACCGARCGRKACLCRSQPARFESQLHTSCTLFFIITYFINSIPYIGPSQRVQRSGNTCALEPGAFGFETCLRLALSIFCQIYFQQLCIGQRQCKTGKWKCRSGKGGSAGAVGRSFDSTSHFFCVKKC